MLEIRDFKAVKKGLLEGFLTVYVKEWDVILRDCGLFSMNDRKWVNLPSKSYTDAEGKTKYAALIDMSKEKKEKFSKECLQALKTYSQAPAQKIADEEFPF